MKTNKERVIEVYAERCEKALPGTASKVSAIANKHWDDAAEKEANSGFETFSIMRSLALRNASFAVEIKSLKS